MSVRLRLAWRLYAALWLALLAGAVGGWVLDDAPASRVTARGGRDVFTAVVATNGRLIGVLVLGALLVARVPEWRPPLDVVIAALLAVNAFAVGAAVGAGGLDVTRTLAHLPLEWAALAAGATVYGAARSGDLRARAGLRWAGVSVAFVVLSAGVEAWAPVLG